MKTSRRFLLASSFARLIKQGRGASRVVEGHFSPSDGRESYVVIEANACHLVLLERAPDGSLAEERAEASRKQCEVLLDVCAGKIGFERFRMSVAGREAHVDRFLSPGPLAVATVIFDEPAQGSEFHPPAWFGPEVTDDAAYANRSLALQGLPQGRDIAISNYALESLLDDLDGRFARTPYRNERREADALAALRGAVGGANGAAAEGGDGLFESGAEVVKMAAPRAGSS